MSSKRRERRKEGRGGGRWRGEREILENGGGRRRDKTFHKTDIESRITRRIEQESAEWVKKSLPPRKDTPPCSLFIFTISLFFFFYIYIHSSPFFSFSCVSYSREKLEISNYYFNAVSIIFVFASFFPFFFGKRTVSQPRRNFIFTEKKKKKKLAILGVASRKNCFGKSLKIFKKYARIDSLSSLLLRVGSFRNFTKIEMAAAARKREESRN